jgi:hypothetical protein
MPVGVEVTLHVYVRTYVGRGGHAGFNLCIAREDGNPEEVR